MKRFLKTRLALLLLLLIAIGFVWYSGAMQQISVAQLKHEAHWLAYLARNYTTLSFFLFILFFAVITICALPLASAMIMICGYLFGMPWGFLYANMSATLGATCSFLLVRFLLGDYIHRLHGQKLSNFSAQMSGKGWKYLLLVRIIPVFPYFLANMLAGLTEVRTRTFLWTTFIGLIPSTFLFALAGQQVAQMNSAGDIMRSRAVLAFFGIGMLVTIPFTYSLIKKWFRNKGISNDELL